MAVDKQTLALLACPLCKGKLVWYAEKQELVCRGDQLAYAIENDIPVLMASKARHLDQAELTQVPS